MSVVSAEGPPITIRDSTELDVPAMVEIYSYHVQHGLGAFELEPLHPEDVKRRRKDMRKHRLPHLVAECGSKIVGFAYAVRFRQRPAYRYTVENSIYVHPDYLHVGVGRLLLPALIERCTNAGFRQMIAVIDSANIPSLKLHESFGFTTGGVLLSVGFKFGRWTDSALMQRALGLGHRAPPSDHLGAVIPPGES